MPRNMSGVYSLPPGLPANGDTSNATDDIVTPLSDLEQDANTVRPVVAGGTGASSASAARTNLGLAIGTDVQAYDADLAAIAALGYTSGAYLIKKTAAGTYSLIALTAAGEAILDDANAATQLVTLGAQPVAATLTSLSGLSLAEGDILYATGAGTLQRLAKGTAGQHLRMNSGATAPEWASEGTALASWTYSSNVTSIPLTGLSGWDSVVVTGFLTISANVQLRVSADNGSTWRSTNYVWRVLDEGGGTDPTDGMDLCRIGSGSIQFDITLQRMSQARSTYASGNARHGNPRMNTFAGIHNVSEVINALQFTGATFSAGFVEVFGIRRA